MKYIISETQYMRLVEQEDGMEFPGIDYFGGDWSIVGSMLDRLTYKGERYSDIEDLMKAYYIDYIIDWVTPQIDIESDDNDHIAIWEDIDLYQSGVDVYNEINEHWEFRDYEDLDISQLELIIEQIKNYEN